MRRKYTSGLHQQVMQLREQGRSYREIARQLGLAHSTILAGAARWTPVGQGRPADRVEELMDVMLEVMVAEVAGPPWTGPGLFEALSHQQRRALRGHCERLAGLVESARAGHLAG